jgi:diguanylate cyclase (GGDEF)-like protein
LTAAAPAGAVYDAAAIEIGANCPSSSRPRELQVADADNQRPTQLTTLVSGAAAVARGTDLDETLGTLVGLAASAVGATSAAISLQDPDRPAPELTFTIGLDEAGQAAMGIATGDAAHPLTAAALERRETAEPGTAAFPLLVGRGGIEQGLGAIAFFWTEKTPDADQVAFLRAVADLVAVATDRFRLASTVSERSEWFERLAHTDPLTGLANMRTFSRVLELELARAGRLRTEVSVAVFDIDDLAATNEAAGHEVGDDVLRSVAAVIAGAVRLVDSVARLGGDEFIVVAPGSAGMTVAGRVLEGVAELPESAGRRITVSAGVARFPVDGTDAESIVNAARVAAARARTEGSGSLEATPG